MPKVRYVGPFDAVSLPSIGVECVYGAEIDVPDADFANLCEQPDWDPVDPYTPAVAAPEPPAQPDPVIEVDPVAPVVEVVPEHIEAPVEAPIYNFENGDMS